MTLTEILENKQTNFNFKSFSGKTLKEYQEWVSNWKSEYKKLTENTRYMKYRRKSSVYGYEVSSKATNICRYYRSTANIALDYRKEARNKATFIWNSMKKVEENA